MQATTISAIAAGVSAAVAMASAIGAFIAARRSKSDKEQAETRADEALRAAQAVAAGVARIADAQDRRQPDSEPPSSESSGSSSQTVSNEQAVRVGFVPSPVQRGRTGWRIKNDSDAPITGIDVQSTTGAKIVIYRGSRPDPSERYVEPVVGAGETTQMMFRPSDSDAAAADPSEVERMRLAFIDAHGNTWLRAGSNPPQLMQRA